MENKEIGIDLSSEYKIRIEDVNNFETSIFSDVYKSARENVLEILKHTNDSKNSYDSYNNIIAFTGERGKGKSSAMISFLEALKQVRGKIEINDFLSPFFNKNTEKPKYNFVDLDVIDPSLFRGNETLFEIVLAKMFSKFKQEIEPNNNYQNNTITDEERRQLVKLFQNVFENLKYTNGNYKDELYKQEALDALIKLSASSNLRESFKALVSTYLKVMSKNSNTENILVITIDDFDLKIEGVYEMLEDVRQFLITENVIVLIACKMEQMREAVQASIYSKYKDLIGLNTNILGKIFEEKEIIQKSSKYIEKLFPNKSTILLKDISKLDLTQVIKGVQESFSNDINHAILGILFQKNNLFIKKDDLNNFVVLESTLRSLSSLNTILSKTYEDIKYFLKNEIQGKDLKINQREKINVLMDSKPSLLKSNLINLIAPEFKGKSNIKKNFLLYPKRIEHVSFSDCNTVFLLLEENFNIYDHNFLYIEFLKLVYCLNNNHFALTGEYKNYTFESYTLINLEDISISNRLKKSDFYKCYRDTFHTKSLDLDLKEFVQIEDKLVISAFVSHLGSKELKYRNESDNIFERKRSHKGNNFKSFQFSIFELFVSIYKADLNLSKFFAVIDESEITELSPQITNYLDSRYYNLFLNPFFVSEVYNLFVLECNNLNIHKQNGIPKIKAENQGQEDYHEVIIDYFDISLRICLEKMNNKYPYLELDYEDYIEKNFVIKLFRNTRDNELVKSFINKFILENLEYKDEEMFKSINEITSSASIPEIVEFLNYLLNSSRIYESTVKNLITKIKLKDPDVAQYLSSFSINEIKIRRDEIIYELETLLSNINNGQSQE
jgi:hypothetical protein